MDRSPALEINACLAGSHILEWRNTSQEFEDQRHNRRAKHTKDTAQQGRDYNPQDQPGYARHSFTIPGHGLKAKQGTKTRKDANQYPKQETGVEKDFEQRAIAQLMHFELKAGSKFHRLTPYLPRQ